MSNSGQNSGKAPEKSNFAQRCNLLSQYLKEKGSFGDINLGMPAKIEAKGHETSRQPPMAMNLLPDMGNSAENLKQNVLVSSNVKSTDFFQEISGFGPTTSTEDTTNKADLRKPAMADSGPAQLTIFYRGQVLVYNEFPVDKVKEIMDLARQGSSSTSSGFVSTSATDRINSSNSSNPVVPDLNVPSASGSDQTEQHLVERIARRASLHRFFSKRKDRVAAKAPYQVNHNHNHNAVPPTKPEESSQLFQEGQSSHQVNHNAVAPPKPEEETNPLLEQGQSSKFLDLRL